MARKDDDIKLDSHMQRIANDLSRKVLFPAWLPTAPDYTWHKLELCIYAPTLISGTSIFDNNRLKYSFCEEKFVANTHNLFFVLLHTQNGLKAHKGKISGPPLQSCQTPGEPYNALSQLNEEIHEASFRILRSLAGAPADKLLQLFFVWLRAKWSALIAGCSTQLLLVKHRVLVTKWILKDTAKRDCRVWEVPYV